VQDHGQHRSTQRHQARRGGDCDDALRERLRKLSAEHRAGATDSPGARCVDEGWAVNRKKIQRLWREEGLRVPQRKRKATTARRLDRARRAAACRAAQPRLGDGLPVRHDDRRRTLKLLHVVDEHTREALAIRVARSIDADHAVRVLDQIVRERGIAPELMPMDNGPR